MAAAMQPTLVITKLYWVFRFLFKNFEGIYSYLVHLNKKAIPNSRGKNALAILKKREGSNRKGESKVEK